MKRILSLVVVGALSVATLWAADPWKEKKYTEWSEKETRKVLGNSPWAKTVTIPLFSGSGFGAGAGGGGDYGPPAGGRPTGGGADSGGALITPGGVSTGQPGYGVQTSRSLQVLVRWQTALPVRQALVRQEIQAEKMTPEEAHQLFLKTPSEYVVMVDGMPRAAVAGMTPEKIKAATYLKTGDGQRIMVQDLRMPEGQVPEARMSQGQVPEARMSQGQVPDLYFVFFVFPADDSH